MYLGYYFLIFYIGEKPMSLIPHRRGRTRRQWARVDLDHAMGDTHAVSDELLGTARLWAKAGCGGGRNRRR